MELLKSGRFDPVPWMEGLYEYEGLIYVLRKEIVQKIS